MRARFHTGCAVWAYKEWVGDLYPSDAKPPAFLELYGQRLTAVEGNTTFYSVPSAETLDRWRGALPPGFAFCLKLPREITHEGPLATRGVRLARDFVEHTARLEDRRGPYFAQFHPDFGPGELPDLVRFLDTWPRDVELAVEVRHPGWFEPRAADTLNGALHHRGMGRVVLDTRPIYSGRDDPQRVTQNKKPELPCFPYSTGAFDFVRFIGHPHGEPRNARYLEQWADAVTARLGAGRRVYYFCHCPAEVHSPSFVRAFHRRLVARGAAVDALPWDAIPPEPEQLELV